ncbi:MAG: hypothetical protein HC783_11225, partial [Rhodobacteraceae bacterium]|nr:hypothetical protein [Paracoccaceae bacterium]
LPIMSVFQFARDFSYRLDVRRFVLGMCLQGQFFMTRERSSYRITAAGAWARRWIHSGGRGAAWLRCNSIYTDSPFVRMVKEQSYEFRLSAMIGRLQRQIRGGDLAQDSLVPNVTYV